ncbi:spermine/spermidine synthase domain-containing protein [Microvirga rosea]|uniref:spermine/spermidine synthase domain-containing protein n=1 Tax=Microvirga rosea TaxID=2715425 RepID=UPI001D0B71FC|nr:spermidine synthase [Microvirga rosea]MCB8821984.1 spermidine synthase [Microvirga rosea]
MTQARAEPLPHRARRREYHRSVGESQERGSHLVPALLLVFSGTVALIYQILWIKQLTLVVGVEVHAIATGVGAFFAGLGCGSLILGRIADRARRPLRLYAVIEIGAAILGLGTTVLLARAAPLFARLEAVSTALAWALPLIAVAAPAALMGGTLPVVIRTLAGAGGRAAASGGRLYAANTFGAIMGALLPPFLLIPALGVQGSALTAAVIGVALGGTALFLDKADPGGPWPPGADRRPLPAFGRDAIVALLLYGIAGAIALGYEIVWSQAIVPFTSTRAFAFSVVLATYLMGLALGAALFARHADRARDPWAVFGLLVAGAGTLALLGIAMPGRWLVIAQTGAEAAALALTGNDLAGMCARFAVAAMAVVLPSTILLGAAFPAALRLVATDGLSGQGTGAVLAVNTIGGIAGTALAGFVLVPALGVVRTLAVLAVLAGAVGAGAVLWGGRSRGLKGAVLMAATLSVAVALALPADGLARVFPGLRGGSLAFYEEGRGGTVAVVERGTGANRFRRLYIQGVSNSGDAMPSLRYMRLQALLPLIVHNGEPRSALVIGYGTGITAGAMLRHPSLDRRVVAELLPAVLRAAPLFKGAYGASSDPRLDIRLRDGRREMQRSDETYDMVTLEPPPPSAAGVVNLYSSDFYRLAALRLRPQGIVAQWLPLPTQNEADTRSLVRSFLDVFPHVTLWTTELHEMLLVGSPDPITLDLARIRLLATNPDVASALAEVGVRSPEALLATYVMGRDGLVRFAGDAPAVTDDHPRIEYATWVRRGDFGLVLQDLLNLRDDVPVSGADEAALAAIASRREELLTFYRAGMYAFGGDRIGWARDMHKVLAADPDNPYYRWFVRGEP